MSTMASGAGVAARPKTAALNKKPKMTKRENTVGPICTVSSRNHYGTS
jgi:hypothetical protein